MARFGRLATTAACRRSHSRKRCDRESRRKNSDAPRCGASGPLPSGHGVIGKEHPSTKGQWCHPRRPSPPPPPSVPSAAPSPDQPGSPASRGRSGDGGRSPGQHSITTPGAVSNGRSSSNARASRRAMLAQHLTGQPITQQAAEGEARIGGRIAGGGANWFACPARAPATRLTVERRGFDAGSSEISLQAGVMRAGPVGGPGGGGSSGSDSAAIYDLNEPGFELPAVADSRSAGSAQSNSRRHARRRHTPRHRRAATASDHAPGRRRRAGATLEKPASGVPRDMPQDGRFDLHPGRTAGGECDTTQGNGLLPLRVCPGAVKKLGCR